MASPPNESRTLASYLNFNEDVDYCSDTTFPGDNRISSHSNVSEDRPLTAPNPFVERGETTTLVAQHHATGAGEHIIINLLDEQQELIIQREERALRRTHTQIVIRNWSSYVFLTPDVAQRLCQTEGRSLLTWAIAT